MQNTLLVLSGILFVLAVFPGIGPQNLNTASHGIRKNHHYAVATTCFIADGLLIIFGGVGLKLSNSHLIITIINIIGIVFILFYLFIKIKRLFGSHEKYKISPQMDSLNTSITRAIALTWLNPLVFMDTIVILGGAASHYYNNDWYLFMLGTIIGDFIWQFGLVSLCSKFSYKLNNVKVWVSLDSFTIIVTSYVLYKTIYLVMH